MTIYSQHTSRGKVQILATYRRDADVISSTVTSVDEAAVAEPIIDALNRVSACATVPVSVSDERTGSSARYPYAHLEAIVDRDQRASLRTGSHSLWYEYAKFSLHQALTDLDTAVAAAPPPVRTAIEAELATEAGGLLAALREYEEGYREGAAEPERPWDDDDPFVLYEGGMRELSTATREGLDQAEEGLSAEQLDQAVTDLRLLSDAYRGSTSDYLYLAVDEFLLTDDPAPEGTGRYFLDIQAPVPNRRYGLPSWTISISQWDIGAEAPETEDETATGETVLDCELSGRTAEDELATLLTLSEKGGQAQLSAWAETPSGEALSGTSFVVTKRYDD